MFAEELGTACDCFCVQSRSSLSRGEKTISGFLHILLGHKAHQMQRAEAPVFWIVLHSLLHFEILQLQEVIYFITRGGVLGKNCDLLLKKSGFVALASDEFRMHNRRWETGEGDNI